MKTLQDLYEEVKASDDLKKTLVDAAKADKVTEILKAHGCDATADELNEFVAEKANRDKPMTELSEEELEKVAGGTAGTETVECWDECTDGCTECLC